MPQPPEMGSYGQFCPVAMTAEVICSRWTALVVREMLCGSTRFNDLRRGVPLMSPTLLSKRLKELEQAGIIRAEPTTQPGVFDYTLTEAGEDLRDVVMAMGFWGQRWLDSNLSLRNLDPLLLMWDMRRSLNLAKLPPRRCVISFAFPEMPVPKRSFWLIIEGRTADPCQSDPGFDVDLYVRASLRSMTAVWMGLSTLAGEIEAGHIVVTGDKTIAKSMQQWLGLSAFAKEKKRVA